MSCSCSYDPIDDYPDVWDVTTPKARVEHVCCECGVTIAKGEFYQRIKSLYDGYWMTHITCSPCAEIRPVFCSNVEQLRDKVTDAVRDNYVPWAALGELSKPAREKVCGWIEERWEGMEDV